MDLNYNIYKVRESGNINVFDTYDREIEKNKIYDEIEYMFTRSEITDFKQFPNLKFLYIYDFQRNDDRELKNLSNTLECILLKQCGRIVIPYIPSLKILVNLSSMSTNYKDFINDYHNKKDSFYL